MIYVFKTSVKSKIQAKKFKPHIGKILPKAKWNLDLEDCEASYEELLYQKRDSSLRSELTSIKGVRN